MIRQWWTFLGVVALVVAGFVVSADEVAHGSCATDGLLFVAGSSPAPAGDRSMLGVMEGRAGAACVTTVADDDATSAMAEGFDAVVVSSSVAPAVLGAELRDAAVPVLVSEPYLFDDMSMVAPDGGKELAPKPSIFIRDASHPLAAGLSGWVSVVEGSGRVNYGLDDAAPGVEAVAFTGAQTARMTIFGFEAGGELTDRPAAGPRVGFFAAYGAELTLDGERLLNGGLDWLLKFHGLTCGSVVTTDVVLSDDLSNCPVNGLVVGASGITIDLGGHTIDGVDPSGFQGGAGVRVSDFDDVVVRNGHVQEFSFGVHLDRSQRDLVEDLTFDGNVHSVELTDAHFNVVQDTETTYSDLAAMRLTRSDVNVVRGNTTDNGWWGVVVDFGSDRNEFLANSFNGGVLGLQHGILLDQGVGTVVDGNHIVGFQRGGIHVGGQTNNTTVSGNTTDDNGIDGIFIDPAATGVTVTANSAHRNAQWGIRAAGAVTDGGGNSATDNGVGSCIGVACAAPGTPRALMIAGNTKPPRGDRQILELIDAAGVDVTIVDDDSDLGGIDTGFYDVVFISSSVAPGKVGDTFKGIAEPVVIWEGFLFDDMGLTRTPSGETSRTRTSMTIVESNHPLAAGLAAGDHVVQSPAAAFSYGSLGGSSADSADVELVAHEPSRPDNAVLLSYHEGDELAGSGDAAGLRVGVFASYPSELTAVGEHVFTNLVDWVLAGGPPGNDAFASAFVATTSTQTGSNRGATSEAGEPLPTIGAPGASVWWTWTADATGPAAISTIGSDFDTVLAIWDGSSLGGLTLLAENDDADGLTSEVSFPAVAGHSYRVAVYGAGGQEGNIQLTIDPFETISVDPNFSGIGNSIVVSDGNPVISHIRNREVAVTACHDPRCATSTSTVLDSWTSVLGSSETSIALGSNGNPVISYNVPYVEMIGSTTIVHDEMKVAVCDDPTCTSAAITMLEKGGNPSGPNAVAIGADSDPVIAYRYGGDIHVAVCDDPTCSSFRIEPVATGGDYPDLAVGTDGNPIIAFHSTSGDDLGVVQCTDPSCTGTSETLLDTAGMVGRHTSIAIGSNGNPLITYHHFSDDVVKIAACTGPSCSGATISAVDTDRGGPYSSVAISPTGLPIVAYASSVGIGGLRFAACESAACDSALVTLIADQFGRFDAIDLALLDDGKPIISYRGDSHLRLALR